MKLDYIAELVDGNGQTTFGQIGPVECAAAASDGESLVALLTRLDRAIEDAGEREVFVDEING